jgi:hypothetical protein
MISIFKEGNQLTPKSELHFEILQCHLVSELQSLDIKSIDFKPSFAV